jgi:maltose alpha-D-glucosyltransferase / alpha-amylase
MPRGTPSGIEADIRWYKDAIIYELHVRAFYDANGDGVGDFKGLTQKLDYLQDLGVTAIWLLPFYPSPLKDDGYDIAEYYEVNPTYGNIQDVKVFIKEAHKRGLRVITELVCNHTSDQHPWFQRARRAKPGSSARDFYVWSDDPAKYKETRIIFKDFETSNWSYDGVAGAYYWHRFYSHQPDLNFDNPQVQKAIFKVMEYWLNMGVDGLRLDAVPYLFERDGTSNENLPETHAFLKKLRAHLEEKYPEVMLLAEANQWPEDSAAYFGDGDECHMNFHFPLMPRLWMSIYMEDRYPILDILDQTPAIPESAQWAIFLRNHDELTLEMVTDEERDYMYRVYASDTRARINLGIRRRLAPLLGNNRRRIELMNGLLFSMPGTPVIYYGDEIGMGDNIYLGDRNGVRTPMQWSPDRNAGFSSANRQSLYFPVIVDPEYHYEAVNVASQNANPNSLLWWMKRLIALRKRYKAFGRGTLSFLQPDNRKVLAFVREYEDEKILVVANLSRFVQAAELDLSQYQGMTPVEMVGRGAFPPIGELPYFVTLGPHSFYWFELTSPRVPTALSADGTEPSELPLLTLKASWEELLTPVGRGQLESLLPNYMRARRWFRGKARQLKGVRVVDSVPLNFTGVSAAIVFVSVEYVEGNPETYVVPLSFAAGETAQQMLADTPHAVLARVALRSRGGEGLLYDPLIEREFGAALLDLIGHRKRLRGTQGELTGTTTRVLRSILGASPGPLETQVVRAEQSNSSIIFGDKLIMKLFRAVDAGVNPDEEIGRMLTEAGFAHTPTLAGTLEYQPQGGKGEPITIGLLQAFTANQGDAWDYTLDAASAYLERALASEQEPELVSTATEALLEAAGAETPAAMLELIGAYRESARLLGTRTAEMHSALAASQSAAFAPEPFTPFYQRSVYQSLRALARQVFPLLRRAQKTLPEAIQADARRLVELESAVLERFGAITAAPINATRIRVHGDYHLGQVLYTGRDFVIIDFEGEPLRPLGERRIKRSALRDVAGMLRSFHYAIATALHGGPGGAARPEDLPKAQRWAQLWYLHVGAAFLNGYLQTADGAAFVPAERRELHALLDCFVLEKAVYELAYELNNRPDWVWIPVEATLQLLGASAAQE